jgi:hypothetical protein
MARGWKGTIRRLVELGLKANSKTEFLTDRGESTIALHR